MRRVDVVESVRDAGVVLVSEIGTAHADVVDDVVPFPAELAGHARRTVHHVVEDGGHARPGQTRVAGVFPAGTDVVAHLRHVRREDLRMVVQADDDVFVDEPDRSLDLLRVEPHVVERDPAELLGQDELVEVRAWLQVRERAVPVVFRGAEPHGKLLRRLAHGLAVSSASSDPGNRWWTATTKIRRRTGRPLRTPADLPAAADPQAG